MAMTNWAGNHVYRAARFHEPATIEELRQLVTRCTSLRVLGTRHSFNDIADTDGDLVSLRRLDGIAVTAPAPAAPACGATVTIEPGVTYGQLAAHLHHRGYALANLASLPHIASVGACATATHGSGDGNGILATSVSAVELLTAGGDLRRFTRGGDGGGGGGGGETFAGAVVALGALGAVTNLTLDVVPTFDVRQAVYEHLPFAAATAHFDEVLAAAYSVSLFTDWRGDTINQVWLKRRVGDADSAAADLVALGAAPATRRLHPITGIPAENCTEQLDLPGPWHERLPHFRMDFTPSAGEELQSEYFVPREHAVEALRAIDALRNHVAPLLQISEIRTIAADAFWMSPCYRRPCATIHFTWRKDWPAVRALLPAIESALAPFDARPHWGKLFTMGPAQLRPLYPRLADFLDLIRTFDPRGKFRNAFMERCVG